MLKRSAREGLRTWIELDRKAFKIKGVPESVCSEFSKRRAEIEEAMAKRGLRGAVAAKVAALDTREAKESVPRSVLLVKDQSSTKSGRPRFAAATGRKAPVFSPSVFIAHSPNGMQ